LPTIEVSRWFFLIASPEANNQPTVIVLGAVENSPNPSKSRPTAGLNPPKSKSILQGFAEAWIWTRLWIDSPPAPRGQKFKVRASATLPPHPQWPGCVFQRIASFPAGTFSPLSCHTLNEKGRFPNRPFAHFNLAIAKFFSAAP
jgi:hypothetical protein